MQTFQTVMSICFPNVFLTFCFVSFVQLGFEFHHAQKDYVLLKKWLPEHEEDNTPNYAAQYLGCGGFVLNSRNQLLVVQEKYHTTPTWKLPGGHAEPGAYCKEKL